MSNCMKVHDSLFSMALNQLITLFVFFHCCKLVEVLVVLLMFSKICLLTRLRMLYAGFISLHFGALWKLSLWSLSVMNDRFWANEVARSWIPSLVAMVLAV